MTRSYNIPWHGRAALTLVVAAALAVLAGASAMRGNGERTPAAGEAACARIDPADEQTRRECWEKLFTTTLDREGMEAAFNLITSLYEAEPTFTEGCHGYTHRIGERAYQLFADRQDIALSPKTSYCG